MSTYSEKLKDPRWQKKRLEVFQRDQFRCRFCYEEQYTLHVHHTKYTGDPWDAPLDDLLTICEMCHELEHRIRAGCEREIIECLKHFDAPSLRVLAHGFRNISSPFSPYQNALTIKFILTNRPVFTELVVKEMDNRKAIEHENNSISIF